MNTVGKGADNIANKGKEDFRLSPDLETVMSGVTVTPQRFFSSW